MPSGCARGLEAANDSDDSNDSNDLRLRSLRQQVRPIAQFATEAGVRLSPRFEPASDGVEHLCLAHGWFVRRGSTEEGRTERRIPPDVVAAAHLVFGETGQQQ